MSSTPAINRRRVLIRKYLEKYPNRTQEQICQYLAKRDINVTQATVSRDVIKIGFRLTDEGYVLDEDKRIEWTDHIKETFKFDPPRIHTKPLYTISIVVNKGTASSIARLIEDEYSDNITGTISGERLVIVYTTSQKNAEGIRKRLSKISSSIKVDVADDDQPIDDEV